jgi:multiple sugar transport system ATP-binding protein
MVIREPKGALVAEIEFQDVAKIYPDGTRAVDGLELQIQDGEFMVFVGPSGCGKTTALRMVAGLEEISEGAILIGDRVVNNVSPKDRDIAMVFQTYALYPHMTVEENLAFGLKLRKLTKVEIGRRVHGAAATLGLEEFLGRKPRALSGGQRQRVAMGRAIVREPQAYLMDEPLSNLDAKLRVQMRAEIHKLQRELGVTTIYVTHDQTEAMTMGDRVAVMLSGHLQQVDNPERLYERPANQFVAGFIGSPAMNMVAAQLSRDDDRLVVGFGPYRLVVDPAVLAERPSLMEYAGRKVILGVRPEDFEDAAFAPEAPAERTLNTVTGLREALGSEVLVHFSVATTSHTAPDASDFVESLGDESSIFVARIHPQTKARDGEPLRLVVNTKRLHFFDPETGEAIFAQSASQTRMTVGPRSV